jgi:ubiquinone biosynthesis protein
VLSREIDCLPEETFTTLETEPFESRLLFQSHHARLNNGMDVVVKVIHPEAESQLSYDLDLLMLLKDAGACIELNASAFKSVVADFAHTIDQQMDFVYEARAFQTLALDAEDYDVLRAPHVYKPLCSSRVLVIEKLDGLRLADVLSNSLSDAASASMIQGVGFERNELARLLCEVWLRQALLGRSFPIEPHSGNILVLPSKQIAFTGGAFASLPSEPQANLWDYLIASANESSDKACSCLLKEMTREAGSSKEDELRQRFRQAMPFRDGGWTATGDSQTVAELLFVHWRFARECGYLPLMHLPGFFRGLFSVADSARRLAPQVDSLAEGLRDLRLLTGLTQFSKMMSRRHVADQLDRYAATIVDLPQSLDEALTFASEGRARVNLRSTDAADHRRARTSSAVVAALLLFLAAVVLLSHYIGTAVVSRIWIERFSAIIFVTLSLLLLRTGLSRAET